MIFHHISDILQTGSSRTRSPTSAVPLLTTTADINHQMAQQLSDSDAEKDNKFATSDEIIDNSTTAPRTVTAATLEAEVQDTISQASSDHHLSDLEDRSEVNSIETPSSSNIPTPVRSFMKDAGLESPQPSPPVSPSGDKLQNYSSTERSLSPSLQSETSTVKAASEGGALEPGVRQVYTLQHSILL